MGRHLIFYDGTCGYCKGWVQFVIKRDPQKKFVFAPLQGETAQKFLTDVPRDESLVLIENYKTPEAAMYQFGKGSFRILWLLGGFWKLIGWISFLPGIFYDWGYRLVANHRHLFKSPNQCSILDESDRSRFLN